MLYKSYNQYPAFTILPTWKSPSPTNYRLGNSFEIIDKFPFTIKQNRHKRNINRIWNFSTNRYPIKRDNDERIKDTILDSGMESENRRIDDKKDFLLASLKIIKFYCSKSLNCKSSKKGRNQSSKEGSKEDFDSNSYFMLRPLKRYSIEDNKISKMDRNFGKLGNGAYFIKYTRLPK